MKKLGMRLLCSKIFRLFYSTLLFRKLNILAGTPDYSQIMLRLLYRTERDIIGFKQQIIDLH